MTTYSLLSRPYKNVLTFIALAFSFLSTQVFANPVNELPNNPEEYVQALGSAGHLEAAQTFQSILNLEQVDNYDASIKLLVPLQNQFPDSPFLLWRLARSYWVFAETQPIDDKDARLKYFQLGLDKAEESIALNANCAECYLYKFANLGRLSTTRGLVNSISSAKELAATIKKSIDLKSSYQDNDFNISLANAYYASGVFYRIIPDWFIVKLLAGVRGDKKKALADVKKAAEIAPMRIDYQVELGVLYLCLAEDKGEKELYPLGKATLEKALTMKQVLPTDPLDKDYARRFLASPKGACGFSRDGVVELDKDKLDKS